MRLLSVDGLIYCKAYLCTSVSCLSGFDRSYFHLPINKILNTNEHVYKNTLDILLNFLKSVKEKHNFFTRICYNLTFNNGFDRSQTHRDHHYSHKQIIIYLNNSEKTATTCMLNKKGKVIKEVVPEKFTGICFDDVDHYHLFPKKGPRLTLVATYI